MIDSELYNIVYSIFQNDETKTNQYMVLKNINSENCLKIVTFKYKYENIPFKIDMLFDKRIDFKLILFICGVCEEQYIFTKRIISKIEHEKIDLENEERIFNIINIINQLKEFGNRDIIIRILNKSKQTNFYIEQMKKTIQVKPIEKPFK